MQSLFVKCQKCQQRPATIKCNQCRYGQTFRLCYSCDSQIHNRSGPIDQQHKTEIIPYQEMYQKNQSIVPVPQKNDQKNSFKKNEIKPTGQVPTKDYLSNDSKKQDYSKTLDVNRVNNKHDYLEKKIDSNDKRVDQQYLSGDQRPYSSNQKFNLDQDRGSQSIINQLKEEQQQAERLRVELSQARDKEKEFQRKLQKVEKDYEQRSQDDREKIQQLTDENRNLNNKLSQANKHLQDEVNKVKKQSQDQIKMLERVLKEKTQELENIAQEYNLYQILSPHQEDIQSMMEQLQQESSMKDQIIEQLQQQLQDNQEAVNELQDRLASNTKQKQQSSNKKSAKSQDNEKDEVIQELGQQLEAKDEEIHKLEDLIENFKQLYQHMSDEKQQLQEEVEKLANENNQFREIFSVSNNYQQQQNLHLFGIDPEQLNEEGEEGENEYPEEIAEENDEQND